MCLRYHLYRGCPTVLCLSLKLMRHLDCSGIDITELLQPIPTPIQIPIPMPIPIPIPFPIPAHMCEEVCILWMLKFCLMIFYEFIARAVGEQFAHALPPMSPIWKMRGLKGIHKGDSPHNPTGWNTGKNKYQLR